MRQSRHDNYANMQIKVLLCNAMYYECYMLKECVVRVQHCIDSSVHVVYCNFLCTLDIQYTCYAYSGGLPASIQ